MRRKVLIGSPEKHIRLTGVRGDPSLPSALPLEEGASKLLRRR